MKKAHIVVMPSENGFLLEGIDFKEFFGDLPMLAVLELHVKKPTRSSAMNAYSYVVLSKAATDLECTIEELKDALTKSYLRFILEGEHDIDKGSILVRMQHPLTKAVSYKLKSTAKMTDGELSGFLEWCVSVIKMVLPNFEAPDPAMYGKERKNTKNEFLVDRNKKSNI